MYYSYEEQKAKLFTEEEQVKFLIVRDYVHKLLDSAGSFRMDKAWEPLGTFDCWTAMAYMESE